MAAKDSPAFYNLTGAIGAYGKALELLVALQQWEEFYAIIGERELPESVTAPVNYPVCLNTTNSDSLPVRIGPFRVEGQKTWPIKRDVIPSTSGSYGHFY
jgi:hypothetical protein